ncbi:MAG: N-acetylmuramoyl-L-alanine amidase [Rubrivivax sp.]|nr:N-acetylmuramoyl-L-alanine amidase [Rubrivivax sp.]MDP3225987.1 N-acetylmuramoyl-L-alanine amidase [Rubrivivax sp.]MDP3610302.1 N-acetylmuramoyl-L-alanine amidase [Rubrivivax sp.]
MRLHPWQRLGLALATALLIGGCATRVTTTEGGVPIDTSHTAQGQDSRAMFLVIHYTVADLPLSLHILTKQQVSAHYLLSDESPPRIFRLVDENRRAWHSGLSGWKGHRLLNASSIGIEIVHPGFKPGFDKQRIYQPFPKEQIDALIPLVKDIVQRHQIKPERILGHGEVTPSYKEDPGPTFPWKLLADLGITPPWPDAQLVAQQQAIFATALPDAAWFQAALAQHGYVIERSGLWDEQTRRVMMNFQMRYRPANYSGQPDAETAALLHVLTVPGPIPGVAPSAALPPVLPVPLPSGD